MLEVVWLGKLSISLSTQNNCRGAEGGGKGGGKGGAQGGVLMFPIVEGGAVKF